MLRTVLAASFAAVLTLAACSNSDVKSAADDTSAATPEDDQPSDADVRTYFEGLASNEPEGIQAAVSIAAPKSIAAAYAQYQLDYTNASIDGGTSEEKETLTKVDGGFKVCSADGGADSCVTWTALESTGGKLANLKVNDTAIADRISVGTGKSRSTVASELPSS